MAVRIGPFRVLASAAVVLGMASQEQAAAQAPAATSENVLWSFGGAGDGVYPHADLIMDAHGNLYGTTGGGGPAGVFGHGTVFELSPPGPGETQWSERLLWSFSGHNEPDGGLPLAGLINDREGNLYGTAAVGSTQYDAGTAFKITP